MLFWDNPCISFLCPFCITEDADQTVIITEINKKSLRLDLQKVSNVYSVHMYIVCPIKDVTLTTKTIFIYKKVKYLHHC